RGASRLRAGHPWIYKSDVSAAKVPPGVLVRVLDDRSKLLGTALYSSASQIALRMISAAEVENWPELIRARVREAIAYRKGLVTDTDAYRLIFSEADFLPGLIVDRYNDLLSLQVLNQAMDTEESRQAFTSELRESMQPAAMIERVDPRVRELEQLPSRESGLLYGEKTATTFQMNGVKFYFSALEGQKTGAFLDQRENYAAAAAYAHGDALDVFCYQGGFALHLAKVCDTVTGVDSSRPALEVADQNATLNRRQVE